MSLLSDDKKMKIGFDDQMVEFLNDLGFAMVSYYGEGFLEKIKYTLNNVCIINDRDKEGVEIKYNTVDNVISSMIVRYNGQNGSRYNLIKYLVEALMTSTSLDYDNFKIVEKVGIATYTYEKNSNNERVIAEGYDQKCHQEFETGATEFDALKLYNLLYPNNELDYSVLSDNGKKAAILMEYPIARAVVNDKRIKNDFLLSAVPNNSLMSDDEMQVLRHYVMGYINNFPNSLKEYVDDIEAIADGTVENCKTNAYNHLNKLRKVFRKVK